MSEKEETQPENSEEVAKWPLPFNIALDKFDNIVKAFFQAQADTKEVTANDLKGRTGLNPTTIKTNTKFLIAIGILKPIEGKDSFTFEPKGTEYAKSLSLKDEKKSSSLLRELLSNSYLKELIDFVELQGVSITNEQLFQHIKTMARLNEDPKFGSRGIAPPYATGISTLIDLLCRAGIVSKDIVRREVVARGQISKKKTAQTIEKAEPIQLLEDGAIRKHNPSNETNTPFTINITVEAKDAESIKQLIELLKELRGKSEQLNP